MYDELTKSDLKKMQEEIDYRVQTLRPKLIEDVQTARAFGDLSENFEYKCAKQEKNRTRHRRYLRRRRGGPVGHGRDTHGDDRRDAEDPSCDDAAAGCAQGAH